MKTAATFVAIVLLIVGESTARLSRRPKRRGDFVTRLLQGVDKACADPVQTSDDCTSDVVGGPRPVCTPFRSPEYCPLEASFPTLIAERTNFVRDNVKQLEEEGWWFHRLKNKIGAYVFSQSIGLPTPELYYCGEVTQQAIESVSQKAFVIRTLDLHSSKGIYVFPNGLDGKELLKGVETNAEDIVTELSKVGAANRHVMIEEFVSGAGGGLPNEFKFHMVNGTVASVSIISNYPCPCWAEVDENMSRLDQYGCFVPQGVEQVSGNCYSIDLETGARDPFQIKNRYDICSEIPAVNASTWRNMVDLAQEASRNIGVYIRVDMFMGMNEDVYVQEYTTNHMNGLRHCTAKLSPSGCIDSCFQGSMWRTLSENRTLGGVKTEIPASLSALLDVGDNAEAMCRVAFERSIEPSMSPIVPPPSAPVVAPTPMPIPLTGSCPSIPTGGCSICGTGMCVSNPDAMTTLPGNEPLTCGDLENDGENGFIPAATCAQITPFIPTCACSMGTSAPNQPSSSVNSPSPAPSMDYSMLDTFYPSLSPVVQSQCDESDNSTRPTESIYDFNGNIEVDTEAVCEMRSDECPFDLETGRLRNETVDKLLVIFFDVYEQVAAPYCRSITEIDITDVTRQPTSSPTSSPSLSSSPSVSPSRTPAPTETPGPSNVPVRRFVVDDIPVNDVPVYFSNFPIAFFFNIQGRCNFCRGGRDPLFKDDATRRNLQNEHFVNDTCLCGAPSQGVFLEAYNEAIRLDEGLNFGSFNMRVYISTLSQIDEAQSIEPSIGTSSPPTTKIPSPEPDLSPVSAPSLQMSPTMKDSKESGGNTT